MSSSKNICTKEYWEIKVQEWASSGKSARAWCKENQIAYTTFLGCRNRLKFQKPKKSNPSNKSLLDYPSSRAHFIELKNQPKLDSGIFLECDGVMIHLSSEFDAIVLKKCLNILRGSIC